MEDDYAAERLHPGDLKPSLAKALNTILQVSAYGDALGYGTGRHFISVQRCTSILNCGALGKAQGWKKHRVRVP